MKNFKSLADYEKDRFGYVENPIAVMEQPKQEQKEQAEA